jgi:enterochelin esterase family protein
MSLAARPCRVVLDRVASQVLRDNPLGDPTERDVAVVLPPSYDEDPGRRYPLLLFLPGFTGAGYQMLQRSPLGECLPDRVARLCAAGDMAETIVAAVDCATFYGGSQYVNSSALGNYEDHVITELLPHLQRTYRTLPGRMHQGVAGKSSGGIGALWLAMRHPECFSAVASHAGDCYFELSYTADFPKYVRRIGRYGGTRGLIDRLRKTTHRSGEMVELMSVLCESAAYAPNPASPYGFDLPFYETTGELRPDVLERFRHFDPVYAAERHVEALRQMRLIFLDAGTRDEFYLDLGTRVLASRLRGLGLDPVHEEFDDGHMNTVYRYDRSFSLLSRLLASPGRQ